MGFLTFWGLAILCFLLAVIGLIFLSYWIPYRLGYKKLGTILSLVLIAGLGLTVLSAILKDHLFFKSDAKEFLSRHNITLNDEFEITYNDSDEILDAYQRFILEVSDSDKLRIIEAIKTSNNFGREDFVDQPLHSITSINYEDDNSFTRKSKQKFGPNEVSIIEIIQVDKDKNTLTCYKYIP